MTFTCPKLIETSYQDPEKETPFTTPYTDSPSKADLQDITRHPKHPDSLRELGTSYQSTVHPLKGSTLCIPPELHDRQLSNLHKGHVGIKKCNSAQ